MRFLFGRRQAEAEPVREPVPEHPVAETNAFCIETRLAEPEALEAEWSFNDRSDRLAAAGHRMILRGLFAEAAEAFANSIRVDTSHFGAYVGRWEAMALIGQAEQAEAEADAALERFGRRCDLGAARAHIYLHRGKADAALEHAEIATVNDPESAYAWLIAGEARLHLPGGDLRARESFRQARAAAEPWPWVELRIALALIEWGHLHDAANLLALQAERDPAVPLTWVLMGDIHRIADRPVHAQKCYRRAAQLVPQLGRLVKEPDWRLRLRVGWRTVVKALSRLSET